MFNSKNDIHRIFSSEQLPQITWWILRSEERKEGVGLGLEVKGTVLQQDYDREFEIEEYFNWSKVWGPIFFRLIGLLIAIDERDDCHESFAFPKGVTTSSVKGNVPHAMDVQSKHQNYAEHAAGGLNRMDDEFVLFLRIPIMQDLGDSRSSIFPQRVLRSQSFCLGGVWFKHLTKEVLG